MASPWQVRGKPMAALWQCRRESPDGSVVIWSVMFAIATHERPRRLKKKVQWQSVRGGLDGSAIKAYASPPMWRAMGLPWAFIAMLYAVSCVMAAL